MTEALLFSVLEISLLPHARTDGQVATYLTDRRKVSGLGDLEAPVLGWTQTRAGAEPSLPAGLIRDQMISQGQESTVWVPWQGAAPGVSPLLSGQDILFSLESSLVLFSQWIVFVGEIQPSG